MADYDISSEWELLPGLLSGQDGLLKRAQAVPNQVLKARSRRAWGIGARAHGRPAQISEWLSGAHALHPYWSGDAAGAADTDGISRRTTDFVRFRALRIHFLLNHRGRLSSNSFPTSRKGLRTCRERFAKTPAIYSESRLKLSAATWESTAAAVLTGAGTALR